MNENLSINFGSDKMTEILAKDGMKSRMWLLSVSTRRRRQEHHIRLTLAHRGIPGSFAVLLDQMRPTAGILHTIVRMSTALCRANERQRGESDPIGPRPDTSARQGESCRDGRGSRIELTEKRAIRTSFVMPP